MLKSTLLVKCGEKSIFDLGGQSVLGTRKNETVGESENKEMKKRKFYSNKQDRKLLRNNLATNLYFDGPPIKRIQKSSGIRYGRKSFYFANKVYCLPLNQTIKFADFVYGNFELLNSRLIIYLKAPEIRYLSTWNRERKNTLIKYSKAISSLDVRVDSNFLEQYEEVRLQIRKLLIEILRDTRSDIDLHITGHRLAGVYAIFAVMDIREQLELPKRVISVTTFGTPRMGNRDFAKYVNQIPRLRITRYTLFDDQIPRFPTRELDGYYHPGIEVWSFMECNCRPSKTNKIMYFRCFPGNGKDGTYDEHPDCINSEKEHEPSFTYDGPYFGYYFGDCSYTMEEVFDRNAS
ncbi:hypothetical protein G9A89_016459 [Geosiphon pyriformis]|nr:hypothetical protein G9A89_016459 [Geosiphon pyriformis]